ncbi:hypothetical protein PTTG_30014 [Puccinia triticina 1-1 BBBD Race 1]|uniref:Uncharacterized protein n=1 Tax=Puccinia triticina (isolate 1-1 / race 1 (BBBD)) TaxID=630390 RepID=A0A180G0U1_PUCT1|nr:hypothetical protein PTTG_30014 [Puccinia triticina 1-1 BBBD Race 1]
MDQLKLSVTSPAIRKIRLTMKCLYEPIPPKIMLKVSATEHFIGTTVDDASFFGVGLILSFKKETKDDNPRYGPCLMAIVSHSDWDPVDRVVKSFKVKYRVPSTPRLIKTQNMFRENKEFFFDGILVGWEMEENMAILEVRCYATSLLIQSPDSVRRSSTFRLPERKRQLVKFSSNSGPAEPVASTSNAQVVPQMAVPTEDVFSTPDNILPVDDGSEGDTPLSTILGGKKRSRKN